MRFLVRAAALAMGAAGAAAFAADGGADLSRRFEPSLQQERLQQEREYYDEFRQEAPEDPGTLIQGGAPSRGGELPESDVVFRLREVRFDASAFLEPERLREIAADYVGREVDFAAVNEMIRRVNDLYAERGIVTARALVPPQRIRDGVLRVRLIEGRLGRLRLEGLRYTREGFIRRRLPLEEGEVIDVPALRDALNYFNTTADVALRASLAPGAAPGETDVRLLVAEPRRFQGGVFVDNNGSESTGEARLGVTALVSGPLGVADRLSAFVVGSEGSINGTVSYELPINRRNGRLQLYYAQGDIEVVHGPYGGLEITGDSSELGLAFDQPLLRRDKWWLDGYLRGARVQSSTEIEGATLSDNDALRVEIGARLTGFGTHHQWALRQGVVWAGTEDVFGKEEDHLLLEGDAFYNRAFGERMLGVLRAGWQWSREDTVSSTLLYQVGGVGSVRGYPSGAVAGASGYFLSLEGRWHRRPETQPFVFLDHGLVEDVSPESESITSVGLGLRWRYGRYLSGELAWGQTLEDVLPDQDDGRLHARLAVDW